MPLHGQVVRCLVMHFFFLACGILELTAAQLLELSHLPERSPIFQMRKLRGSRAGTISNRAGLQSSLLGGGDDSAQLGLS